MHNVSIRNLERAAWAFLTLLAGAVIVGFVLVDRVEGQEIVVDSISVEVYGEPVGAEVDLPPGPFYANDTIPVVFHAVDSQGQRVPAIIDVELVRAPNQEQEQEQQQGGAGAVTQTSDTTAVVVPQVSFILIVRVSRVTSVVLALLAPDSSGLIWDDEIDMAPGEWVQGCGFALWGDRAVAASLDVCAAAWERETGQSIPTSYSLSQTTVARLRDYMGAG